MLLYANFHSSLRERERERERERGEREREREREREGGRGGGGRREERSLELILPPCLRTHTCTTSGKQLQHLKWFMM